MNVYQFKMWGRKFAVDMESGNFFEVDKIASEAITMLHRYPEKEVQQKLNKKYTDKSVNTIVKDLSQLRKRKILFSACGVEEADLNRRITDLTLNIVEGCNLSCRYCWNEGGAYGGSNGKDNMMTPETAFKAINLLVKESNGAKSLVVDFYGGEPLLNYDLIRDVVYHCKEISKTKKIKFRFLLATNGTLLTKEKATFLIDNGVDVAVSLDGPEDVQNTQRPFSDGQGSFSTVIENLNSLSDEYRKKIVGRATFTPYSVKIIRTFKFLRKVGFDRIEICESEQAGYGLEDKKQFFFSGTKGIQHLKTLYYKLARFYANEVINGNLTYENTYFNRFFKQLSRLYNIKSVVGSCSAGFTLMSVDIDGSIYPCTAFIGIKETQIGNVNNGSGIKERNLNKLLSTKISSSDECQTCWAKKICQGCGSCYNLNYFAHKNIKTPDPYYCELFLYKTKLMIAMLSEIGDKDPQLLEDVLIPEYFSARGKVKK